MRQSIRLLLRILSFVEQLVVSTYILIRQEFVECLCYLKIDIDNLLDVLLLRFGMYYVMILLDANPNQVIVSPTFSLSLSLCTSVLYAFIHVTTT